MHLLTVVGFMDDRGRSNVAMTRAREVFWIIGGPLTAIRTSSNVPSPFPKLKREMERQGKVHKLQPLRPEEGSTEQAPGREALGHSSVARALLC